MASISASIELYDRMSAPLQAIMGAMHQTVSTMYDMQGAMNSNIDTSFLDAVVEKLNEADAAMERVAEETNQARNEQQNFNHEVDNATKGMNGLESAVQKVVGAIGGMFAIQKVVGFINDATDAASIQTKAETQLATTLINMGGGADDYDAIVKKAQEIQQAGMYGDEAMLGAAAEFSTYMSDTSAVELMMDTLTDYAAGMSGGGAINYDEMVNYATNLGKITTGAYDAMTKKGFEFTDAQKAVIDGSATEAQYAEALGSEWRSMSEDMRSATVIADIINESWSGMYDTMSMTPEAQLQSLKNTMSDLQEQVGNRLNVALAKLYQVIAQNMPLIERVMMSAANGLANIIEWLAQILDAVMQVANFISENWSIIEPIIMGIVTALGLYYGAMLAYNTITGISTAITYAKAFAEKVHAASLAMQTGATFVATAAQYGFNAALMACPLVWIILLVIAVVAVMMMLCEWIAKATGAAESGIGIVVGSLAVAGAFIGNLFIALINLCIDVFVVLWNFIAAFVNFFGNVFTDPIGAIARLFFGLVDCILGLLQALASAIDAIFGSSLAASVQGWRDGLTGWVDETFGQGDEVMATLNQQDMHLERFEYGKSWDAGVALGDSIAGMFSSDASQEELQFDPSSLFDSEWADSLEKNGGATAENTGALKDSVDITNENLKYLRDAAETEAINRFTTAEIKVEMTNNNNVASGMDIDGMVDHLSTGVQEAMEQAAEGVHE